jgi:hypothetical protein
MHSVARPKTDPVLAEREALIRIAELAASIASTLRQPDRGRYNSERQLRSWLTDDGVQLTVADIAPSLALLEATQRLIRPEVGRGTPRPGWLPEHAPEAVEDAPEPRPGSSREGLSQLPLLWAVDCSGSSRAHRRALLRERILPRFG